MHAFQRNSSSTHRSFQKAHRTRITAHAVPFHSPQLSSRYQAPILVLINHESPGKMSRQDLSQDRSVVARYSVSTCTAHLWGLGLGNGQLCQVGGHVGAHVQRQHRLLVQVLLQGRAVPLRHAIPLLEHLNLTGQLLHCCSTRRHLRADHSRLGGVAFCSLGAGALILP